ncbi:MAG: DNA-binding response regulator [Thermobacillus sp.]|uniref:response regulator n=1 Tax=Thermobacillus sp. TaxID=2108467 RepID=UPI000E39D743|nr:response regulator [Thermobacillus sp.]REK56565.1 MAG: DNA-binding response regulator [Thermobacillus sp.]
MIRVLLVDDEEDALNLMEILLKQIGDVEVIGKYANALRALESLDTASVDAVFLDNQMPGMTGMEAARRIREKLPRIPIVFTTAYPEYAVEAFEVRSTDYLLKLITLSRLQQTVARLREAASPSRSGERLRPSIRCMGGFAIGMPEEDGLPLSWKINKEKEVCAFLIHHEGKPADTELIVEAIWPGHDVKKAKTYLYTCLSYLRRTLQEHGVPLAVEKVASGFAIRMNGAESDAAVFERLLDAMLAKDEPDRRLYDEANRLYQGEYMEGCDYGWAAARQEAINAKYIRSLRTMHRQFLGRGELPLAADCLRRVLAIAPESEADGRELIRLNLETGDRHEALNVYRRLEEAVRGQLGLELEEETIRLRDQMGWFG